jgi:hypothetical protein
MTASIDALALKSKIGEILNSWPVAGLAVRVVSGGSLAWFHGHGVADIEAGTPVGQDTVFRIASVTKTITAVFRKRPGIQNPRPWTAGALGVGALALAAGHWRRRDRAARKRIMS